MSAELIGILSVGAALGGLVPALQSRTDKRLDGFEKRFGEGLAGLRGELRALGAARGPDQGFRPVPPRSTVRSGGRLDPVFWRLREEAVEQAIEERAAADSPVAMPCKSRLR